VAIDPRQLRPTDLAQLPTPRRWLYLLGRHGVIKQVEKGDRAKRRASRFRYPAD